MQGLLINPDDKIPTIAPDDALSSIGPEVPLQVLETRFVGEKAGKTGGIVLQRGDAIESVVLDVKNRAPIVITDQKTVEIPTAVAITGYKNTGSGVTFSGVVVSEGYLREVSQKVYKGKEPGWEIVKRDQDNGLLATQAAVSARAFVNNISGMQRFLHESNINAVDIDSIHLSIHTQGPPFME